MRLVTIFKTIPFNFDADFPLVKYDIVSNNTFMRSDKKWSVIVKLDKWHENTYKICLVPVSNVYLFRVLQRLFLILKY